MNRRLKLWNGRERYNGEEVSINVAAPSLAAAVAPGIKWTAEYEDARAAVKKARGI